TTVPSVGEKPAAGERPGLIEPGRPDLQDAPLPPAALARLGTLRFRHIKPVQMLAFAPDGRALFSSDNQGKVFLWEVNTGRELRRWDLAHVLTATALSPDGKRLAAGAPAALVVWDLETGKELVRSRSDSAGWLTSLAFSPDGRLLAWTDILHQAGLC